MSNWANWVRASSKNDLMSVSNTGTQITAS